MTPFAAPGAGAKPPAATPRAQGAPIVAAAPRPMVGSSYGNLGTPVRVAPSPTPRAQAPLTARMPPGVQIARPRVPLAPHAQGAPVPGVQRPVIRGGAPMAGFGATTQTPRMQAPTTTTRAPGIPPNTLGVGAAVPSARPHVQPTQRAPAVASPAEPSLLGKRAPPTMGPAHIQQAKRQATAPRPQGAPTGGVPPPTNPAAPAVGGVRAASVPPPEHAQGAATAGNATPSRPPQPKLPYVGVYHDPSKGWMARVMDLKRRAARSIGPFGDPHLAALAQDRAAIACAGRGIGVGGGGARLNFEAAFYRVETAFLHRWEGDLCGALEEGTYEESYARFLKAGYKVALKVKPGDDGGEEIADGGDELIASCVDDGDVFWDDIEDFFLSRAGEIGKEALEVKDGGKLLRSRFVEMHRNKSLCPEWRRNNLREKLKTMVIQKQQQQQIQMQQQEPQIQMNQEQQQNQMKQEQQQQQIQQQQQQQKQQQQIQMQQQQWQQQKQQQQIQMQQQQQFQQQQMMIQKQRQQQMMMAQQQQQYVDDDATLQVKKE